MTEMSILRSVKVEFGVAGSVITRVACLHCGCTQFELVGLGVPGAGSSVCLDCRRPVAGWARGDGP